MLNMVVGTLIHYIYHAKHGSRDTNALYTMLNMVVGTLMHYVYHAKYGSRDTNALYIPY